MADAFVMLYKHKNTAQPIEKIQSTERTQPSMEKQEDKHVSVQSDPLLMISNESYNDDKDVMEGFVKQSALEGVFTHNESQLHLF